MASTKQPPVEAAPKEYRTHTLFDWIKRMARHRLCLGGFILLSLIVLMSVFAPFLTPHDPLTTDPRNRLLPPSEDNWLGTDPFGRDLFARIVFGSRLSLIVGLLTVFFSTVGGIVLGLLAGYFPRLDAPVMRVVDGLMAFPSLLLAIALMGALGAATSNVIIALSVVYAPRMARIVRGSILSVREMEYVDAARASGAGDLVIMLRHILPNCFAPIMVQATFTFAFAVLAEAALSFLGAGTPPPTPSLGNIMTEGRPHIRGAPWIIMYPGLVVMITVMALNLMGDGLRDTLDPRLRT